MPKQLANTLVYMFLLLAAEKVTATQANNQESLSNSYPSLNKFSPKPTPSKSNSNVDNPMDASVTQLLGVPIATLFGKPIYHSDCLSRSSGIGSFKVGFQRLVLTALKENFCRSKSLSLSQKDLDTYEEKIRAFMSKRNMKVPSKQNFDMTNIQEQLDDVKTKLSVPNLPWLEMLALKEFKRSYLFALKHNSLIALQAYNQLMPLRCDEALYNQYAGKVIVSQLGGLVSIGAYMKLIQEAEDLGNLQFHDKDLKKAFFKKMSSYLLSPEIPPNRLDFDSPPWSKYLH
ncbi:MAG: hypothetical protein KAR12_08220 [Methylococcales bacterium]|nr:hypothetical protein [Methylococcales bacterium]